jgi:hypothetical protein
VKSLTKILILFLILGSPSAFARFGDLAHPEPVGKELEKALNVDTGSPFYLGPVRFREFKVLNRAITNIYQERVALQFLKMEIRIKRNTLGSLAENILKIQNTQQVKLFEDLYNIYFLHRIYIKTPSPPEDTLNEMYEDLQWASSGPDIMWDAFRISEFMMSNTTKYTHQDFYDVTRLELFALRPSTPITKQATELVTNISIFGVGDKLRTKLLSIASTIQSNETLNAFKLRTEDIMKIINSKGSSYAKGLKVIASVRQTEKEFNGPFEENRLLTFCRDRMKVLADLYNQSK